MIDVLVVVIEIWMSVFFVLIVVTNFRMKLFIWLEIFGQK